MPAVGYFSSELYLHRATQWGELLQTLGKWYCPKCCPSFGFMRTVL